jgi:hypothetical protein
MDLRVRHALTVAALQEILAQHTTARFGHHEQNADSNDDVHAR